MKLDRILHVRMNRSQIEAIEATATDLNVRPADVARMAIAVGLQNLTDPRPATASGDLLTECTRLGAIELKRGEAA